MLGALYRERRRSNAVRTLLGGECASHLPLDRFVGAAASSFSAPIAALSLIRDDQQIIVAGRGIDLGRLPRHECFCTFVLDGTSVLECCALSDDPRFASLPAVMSEPHVRYYIGAPLRLLSGVCVGALCVVDTIARAPASTDQKAYLLGLARQASMALESSLDLIESVA